MDFLNQDVIKERGQFLNKVVSYFEGYTKLNKDENSVILSKLNSTLDYVQYFIQFRIQQSHPIQMCVEIMIKTGIKVPPVSKTMKIERRGQIEQSKRILEKYEIVDNDLIKAASNLLSQVSEENLKVQFSKSQLDLMTSSKNFHRFCKGTLIFALETFCSSPTYRKIYNSGKLILPCMWKDT